MEISDFKVNEVFEENFMLREPTILTCLILKIKGVCFLMCRGGCDLEKWVTSRERKK